MNFSVTFSAVAVMLLYALPGYLLVRLKQIDEQGIPFFTKVLVYVSQPCLTVYSFCKMDFSVRSASNLLLAFLLTSVLQLAGILLFYLLVARKKKKIIYRVINIATVFSNCGFLGVPLLERILPQYPEAVAYSSVYALSMNMIGWTLGMYLLSGDKKYISAKKVLLNPAVVSLAVAVPFYIFGISLGKDLDGMIALLARMSTPLCMLIMGMRLATVPIKSIFGDAKQYLAVGINQILYPFFAFLTVGFLPIDYSLRATIVILSACPIASMVQNFAELLGEGQKPAANMVLLGTLSSIITVPLLCLLVNFIPGS